MSRIRNIVTIAFSILYATFGSSLTRKVDDAQLEKAIGRTGTIVIWSIPVITVVVWLVVWAVSRIMGIEGAEDPLAWWRSWLSTPDP